MAGAVSDGTPVTPENVSREQARRIALKAQGLASSARSPAAPGWARMAKTIDQMNLLQIDSVNVLVRSHYLPVFSRLGAYDRALLDQHTLQSKKRAAFEYWAHEASLLPFSLHPLMRWRMADARAGTGLYKGLVTFARERASYVAGVLAEVRGRGPLGARDIADAGERTGHWWGWRNSKSALEYLFWTGDVTTCQRRGFERIYDLSERVIPADTLNLPAPPRADAIAGLVDMSARALGIATPADLRDYFRLALGDATTAIARLVEEKRLTPAIVEGWDKPAYLHASATLPGRATGTALLSPFDPVVWNRQRAERLFDFRYRIEIYTPAGKRRYGYYVLPFMHKGRIAGRVCLKADRQAGLLRANASHLEAGYHAEETAGALAGELGKMAGWLGLDGVSVSPRGNLAGALARASGN